mmetsp:Transcript_86572/g.220574  ORF Transcript_86572/g.220574 Transcript_86572/m.220574 type:complete len:207 (-) Transcript_86572:1127-1747(-)
MCGKTHYTAGSLARHRLNRHRSCSSKLIAFPIKHWLCQCLVRKCRRVPKLLDKRSTLETVELATPRCLPDRDGQVDPLEAIHQGVKGLPYDVVEVGFREGRIYAHNGAGRDLIDDIGVRSQGTEQGLRARPAGAVVAVLDTGVEGGSKELVFYACFLPLDRIPSELHGGPLPIWIQGVLQDAVERHDMRHRGNALWHVVRPRPPTY